MHPAPSVIIFTSLSGLGFGLLAFLGFGLPASTGWVAFAFFFIGYALAVGGLLASTFHLGHPERALKAFTQWKTSWLSREAWAAVAALVIMGIYALGRIFWGVSWQPVGWLAGLLCLITVYSTAMIYGQLKTVPRWNMSLTPAMFLSYAVAGGALLAGQVSVAVPLLIVMGAIQIATWMQGDRQFAESGTDMATATGLGNMGRVRAFEPPHTGGNYLTREFTFVVGRKHAFKLRVISLGLSVLVPTILLLLPFNHFFALIAVAAHVAGVFVARWLFFAQAEHVVGLYYGKR